MIRCPQCRSPIASADWTCDTCRWSAPRDRGVPLLAPALAYASDGFVAGGHARLFEAEQRHFWFDARNALILWALRRYFRDAHSMLEIGCGTGYVTSAIERNRPHLTVTGAELFADGAALAVTRLHRSHVIQADGRALPFENEFDVAGAFDVLEHIEDDELVLRQLNTSLRPAGGLVITVPQHPWLWRSVDEYSHHKRRYTRRELVAKVRAAGFDVLRCTSFVTLLLPVMLVSRAGRGRTVDDPMREFRLPVSVNQALGRVMDVERLVIRAGASLPAGGSLLLVAEKSNRPMDSGRQ